MNRDPRMMLQVGILVVLAGVTITALVSAERVVQGAGPLSSNLDPEDRRRIEGLLQSAGRGADLAPLTVDYPLDGSIFPGEMLPPTFLWHDTAADADRWLIEVTFEGSKERLQLLVDGGQPPEGVIDPLAVSGTNEIYRPTAYQASAQAWRPSPDVWQAIKANSIDRNATLVFHGYQSGQSGTFTVSQTRETVNVPKALSRGSVTLRTSSDPVDGRIFYRDVPLSPAKTSEGVIAPLPKGAIPLINWRLRDLSQPESRVLLTNMPTCANCHSFSADGGTLGIDVDGPTGDKGAYAIAPIARQTVIDKPQVITWSSFPDKPAGHKTLGFLSQVSPDGQWVLSTVNEQIYVVNFDDYRFGQVFYPTRGILASYSRETGEMRGLPGADDPDYVHTDGVWTPDGQTVVFARARARDAYIKDRPPATYAGDPNETPIQYDLYRMPFNAGRGGRPEPIAGASNNGMSNTFPKVSPDGRWIVFTQCANGQLMRPDGKLWIVPLAGGEPRLMRCNTPLMNSWHSFSPNGRWMVFSSKSNTPYTQMFLTHIDEQGNDSPAVLIENSTAANRAVNIPEFVKVDAEDFTEITVPAVEHYRNFNRGNTLAIEGKLEEAVAEFRRALEHESTDSRIHDSLSKVLLHLGREDEALAHIRRSLEINPYNMEMHSNLGYLLTRRREYPEALEHLTAALRLHPGHPVGWTNRAALYIETGNHAAAIEDYSEAIRLRRGYADAYTGRGIGRFTTRDYSGALSDFAEAIRLKPHDPTPWYFRALARKETGDAAGAREDARQALQTAAPDFPRHGEIQALVQELGGTPERR